VARCRVTHEVEDPCHASLYRLHSFFRWGANHEMKDHRKSMNVGREAERERGREG